MKPAWVEFGGLSIARSKEYYEHLTAEEYDKILKEECSVSEEVFALIAKEFNDKISSKFE